MWSALVAALWLAVAPSSAKVLTPPYFNLAEGRKITATATCGDEGPELYCKLVGANAHNDNNINVIQGQVCDICDLNTPGKNHPPEFAVDGMESWWQSPPLSRGMRLNEVNLTIDLGQEFHVAYVFVRMGNSPRPGLWALEKSSDYGKTYTPWQYFSDSPSDCVTNFGKESLLPITRDDSVICNTEYSKIVPLEAGEIPIPLLINRPSANMYFNSSVLQEWTRATNIRLRLLRTKTLLGHLMSVARQDPTVTRRYFYSIKDISIGGRCMCNGHADTCDIPDPVDPNKLQCRCQHHTCGPQCEKCCPGFEQKAWRQSSVTKFICEACNCFNHSDKCVYNPDIDAQHLSLDIHGKYDGGGVCTDCQHNTEGINCNKCKSKYYRPYQKKWEEIDVCRPCDCDDNYSTGNCAEGTGQCECRKEFKSPYCDECSYGYFGYPDCKPCICNLNGTDGDICEPIDNYCPCKSNYDGNFCETCAEGYYNFPKCERCNCNQAGAISSACEQETGNCTCKSNFGGRTCEQCEAGFYQYPTCHYCNCDISGTLPQVCDNFTGICICKEGFGGSRCDQCIAGYYSELRDKERVCVECHCFVNGSTSTTCDSTGKCSCLNNFVGKRCDKCSPGYYKYPECLPCNCDSRGSEGVACDETGQCNCKGNFDDLQCSSCKESFYNFPRCEECNCDPNGIIQSFAGCGSVPAGELCQCKDRVQGRICDECRPLYWNLQQNNILGCQECDCDVRGTQAGIGTCDMKTGQCSCKHAVSERGCSECKDGSYNLTESNIFGCTDCGCDVGGAVNNICNKDNGKCKCRPRIEGLHCDKPLKTHYFPTLHQFQYEIEDGQTPVGSAVRYGFSEDLFPDFSWKGYATFSLLQDEVQQNVEIEKSSVYWMILRYVNQNPDPILGKITIIPDNPSETEQSFEVLIKPSSTPRFVTVSGIAGTTPSPFVMNPGRWTVSIKIDKNLLLDYFVLIPSSYYEATILLQKVNNPCEINGKGLCRHFGYPNIDGFDSAHGSNGQFSKDNQQYNINKFIDSTQIKQLQEEEIPLINDDEGQLDLKLIISEPGDYVLLLEYVTPVQNGNMGGGYITANVHSGSSKSHSKIYLNPCTYTHPCRHVLLDDNKTVQLFSFEDDLVQATFKGEGNAAIGLKSIVAIPVKEWHTDFIKPEPICIRKNGKCAKGTYPFPPNSKKIEFETGNKISSEKKPMYIYDNNTELLYLSAGSAKDLVSKVPGPGQYVFVVQYYQPNHPENKMEVLIENGQFYEGFLPIKHCPSNSGCRSVVQTADGNNRFALTENFDISLRANNEIWLDHLLIIPANEYNPNLLDENKFDQTREFISTCGSNHFHINITEEGFCRDAVFSLTSDYNNGAESCRCDYLGSHSFECDLFGGQCKCKPNIIGRKCEICKTGYYGFPDCKPCNCPSTALCEKEFGQCICPPRVTGEKCDKCMPLTYGVDPIIGCVDCNCDPSGVENDLQCDLFNGSCTCKTNVVGRACDKCEAGHFQFPDCEECDCDLKGSTKDICDQDTAICSCKQHVYGSTCDTCREGTFDLREDNEDGCTKCFCFGKTIRCNSANNLYWDKISDMEGWALFDIEISSKIVVTQHSRAPKRNSLNSISAAFSSESDKFVVYFGAPKEYLGNKLTSYGGILKYTLFYSTGIFGNAISNVDIILQSTNISLLHSGIEQPPIGENWDKSLYLTESEFVTLNQLPATRELLMTVLENLQGVYIRATYWESTITTRLENVSLDFGNDLWDTESKIASSVEECQCPVNYKGYSCEDCAEGFYRIPGTHGGICIPCQCNGHASSCDVNTGICNNCQHATIGDHCEMCIEGYHGNATVGTPNDCLICACPLPTMNNNFATSCEVSSNGDRISCNCKPGYFGARCESCAAGYFGQPETPNEFCKPCECSGNINPSDPSSCDTRTGQCLKCMNNTYGASCSLCEPGFFGDAIVLKDCQVCICDQLGMARCNSHTGSCECQDGVIGDKCDRCEDEHWGFEFGNGCSPCNCSVASQSKQCHDSTGQCKCMPGVTGKNCDRCAPGFWNFSPQGCITCDCNSNYSVGFGCNVNTGHCECLQGVVGEKCDRCPYRYVLIPEQGCFKCDSCTHDLLNSTEILSNLINPIMDDIETKASSYFTAQRLFYIEDKVMSLRDSVYSLDTNAVDLNQISNKMNQMESMWKNLDRTANYAVKDSAKNKKNAETLVKQWEKVLNDAKLGSIRTNETVKQIWQLADNLVTGHGQKVDSALAEGQKILAEIKDKEFSAQLKAALSVQNFTNETFDNFKKGFNKPLNDSQLALKDVHKQMSKYNDDLDDLLKIQKDLQNKIESTEKLNEMPDRISNIKNKVSTINNNFHKSNDNLENATHLLKNASKFLELTKNGLVLAEDKFNDGFMINDQVNKTLNEHIDDMNNIRNLTDQAEKHQNELLYMSNVLQNLLKTTTNNTQTDNAVKAASAYSDIAKEINEAENASLTAENAVFNASELNKKLRNHIAPSKENSTNSHTKALNALNTVQAELRPKLSAAEKIIDDIQLQYQKADDENNAVLQSIPELPESLDIISTQIKRNSTAAQEKSKKVSSLSDEIDTENKLLKTQNISKDVHDSLNNIVQIEFQLNNVHSTSPNVSNLIENVRMKEKFLNKKKESLEKLKGKLEKSLATAKDTVNRIKVGVHFNDSTYLLLPLPDDIEEMGTTTHISVYFKTSKDNGFLLYLGNQKGTKVCRVSNADFIALEIENKYPFINIDTGNGPEKITSTKIVSDDVWYQAIIDRVGNRVNFTIREQLPDGSEYNHVARKELSGTKTVLNYHKDLTKLFVGGYSVPEELSDHVKFDEFEGQMEELVIGDTPIGFWNFIEAQDNNYGAIEREILLDKSTSGFRFNGESYVVIDGRSYLEEEKSSVEIRFSTYASDGLLFLIGKEDSFLSIELQNGSIFFQFRLGSELVVIGSLMKYNDGKQHTVQALRYRNEGKLSVDNVILDQKQSYGDDVDTLTTTGYVYLGGYPGKHHYIEVTNTGFDGCIDDVKLSSYPVDLNIITEAFGVKPGCPNKISSSVKVDGQGSITIPNITIENNVSLSIRFKTSSKSGLIFYATDRTQEHSISLSLVSGSLSLISQEEKLTTGANTYNDNQWHTVTINHDNDALRLVVDDCTPYMTDSSPPRMFMMYGTLYIGGVPAGFIIRPARVASKESFKGCLGDAIINNKIINFAADEYGKNLRSCKKPVKYSNSLGSLTAPLIPGTNQEKSSPELAVPKEREPMQRKPMLIQPTTKKPIIVTPPAELPPKQITTKPSVTLTPASTKSTSLVENGEKSCAAGYDPISSQWNHADGFRFGTRIDSRVEFDRLPDDIHNDFRLSVDFNSKSDEGLIFYASDIAQGNSITLFIHKGQIYFNFDYGNNVHVVLESPKRYGDSEWHKVIIKKVSDTSTLIIDDEKADSTESKDLLNPLILHSPFYFGGINISGNIYKNLESFTYTPFDGCLKNFKINGKPVESIKAKINALPCLPNEDDGIYFRNGGGFLKLMDSFNVGTDTTIQMQVKLRNSSGVLVSVHGKKHYFILEIVNSTLVELRAYNGGREPTVASYVLNEKNSICDGKWHTIHGIKSKHVLSLGIDENYGDAVSGYRKPYLQTSSALFIGGHPSLSKKKSLKGATVTHGFTGCIRNIVVGNHQYKDIPLKSAHGDVHVGMCPPN